MTLEPTTLMVHPYYRGLNINNAITLPVSIDFFGVAWDLSANVRQETDRLTYRSFLYFTITDFRSAMSVLEGKLSP